MDEPEGNPLNLCPSRLKVTLSAWKPETVIRTPPLVPITQYNNSLFMPPSTPEIGEQRGGKIMSESRKVWVKIRANEAERADWHAKARSVGLSLSDLVRRSVGRVRTWTVAHAELERERTRELARIGSNLNQIARWANIYRENAEAVEVIAHLAAIERTLDTLVVEGDREQ